MTSACMVQNLVAASGSAARARWCSLSFFFQAEDGIRDHCVTGVQTCALPISNGDPARFAAFGLHVVPDGVAGFPGPLAGILAGLDWVAANRPEVKWMLSAAADCPFLPRDLVSRLHQGLVDQDAELAVAASSGQSHPVIGLWSVSLREKLRHALVVEDVRKIDRWTARYRLATVTWPVEPLDPFFNANTVEDIAEADRLAALDGG